LGETGLVLEAVKRRRDRRAARTGFCRWARPLPESGNCKGCRRRIECRHPEVGPVIVSQRHCRQICTLWEDSATLREATATTQRELLVAPLSDEFQRDAAKPVSKVRLRCFLSPGDILMLTAAVRDLHKTFPGRFVTAVQTTAPDIWENNPYVTQLSGTDGHVRTVTCHYPLIHEPFQRTCHFVRGFHEYLSRQLGVAIPVTEYRGDVHLTGAEKEWPADLLGDALATGTRYWLVFAGGKHDYTAKWWPSEYYQAVVDSFRERIQFVQCGGKGDWHPPLDGVVNLVGKTTIRDVLRLVYSADGVLCPVTFAMHAAAALPREDGSLRPCVVISGAREPANWEQYPGHQFLQTVGCLPCAKSGACWRSRCQKVGDGDEKDRSNLCSEPVEMGAAVSYPKCMVMIKPTDVVRAIERYYESGILHYL